MPEATIEEPPKQTTPAAHPGAVTIDLGNLGKKAQPDKKPEEQTPPPTEEKKPEEQQQPPPTNDKETNLANLRKAREAAETARKVAEEERDRLKSEFEALKTKAPELPEDVKTRLTKAEEAEKQVEELRRTVRQLDLSRDPEFQAKYNAQITDRIGTMGSTALAAGIPEAEWKNAVANWNEDQFAEWSESMTPVQRVKFNAAWTAAVDLYQKQQAELKNADQVYHEMQKQRQAEAETQQKTYFSQNEQLARSVMAETIKPETLKEYEDLGAATESLLLKAARHEIPAKDIFQQLAANQVLARVTVKQKSRIDELEAQLAERDKKISEQDTFIANAASGVPRGDAAGASGGAKADGPLWKNIVVKSPGS